MLSWDNTYEFKEKMKIKSINTEYTKDANEVALDFDMDIDDNVFKKLQSKSEYYKENEENEKMSITDSYANNLSNKTPYICFGKVKTESRVLTITVTTANQDWRSGNGAPVNIAREHIDIINDFLSEIEDEDRVKSKERYALLQEISKNTGLPLSSKNRAYTMPLNL